jgi:hypothetical protein
MLALMSDRFPALRRHLLAGSGGLAGEVDYLRRVVGIAVSAIEATLSAGFPVVLNSNVFVHPVSGSDTTGRRGRQDLPFKTVSAALVAAQDNDVVNLAAGTYTGAVTVPDGKTLTIRGQGPSQTIVTVNTPATPAMSWSPTVAKILTLRDLTLQSTSFNTGAVGLAVAGSASAVPLASLELVNVSMLNTISNLPSATLSRLLAIKMTGCSGKGTGASSTAIVVSDYGSLLVQNHVQGSFNSTIGATPTFPIGHTGMELRSGSSSYVVLGGRTKMTVFRGYSILSLSAVGVSDANGTASLVCAGDVGGFDLTLSYAHLVDLRYMRVGSGGGFVQCNYVGTSRIDLRHSSFDVGAFTELDVSGAGVNIIVDMRGASFEIANLDFELAGGALAYLDRDGGTATGRTATAAGATTYTLGGSGTTGLTGRPLPPGVSAVPSFVGNLGAAPLPVTAFSNTGFTVNNTGGALANVYVTWQRQTP